MMEMAGLSYFKDENSLKNEGLFFQTSGHDTE